MMMTQMGRRLETTSDEEHLNGCFEKGVRRAKWDHDAQILEKVPQIRG